MADLTPTVFPCGHDLIAAERARQVEVEGWTPEHDREHGWKRLRMAAWAYETSDLGLWPWDREWWKPKGPLRNLVRAGALYQAAADVAETDDRRDYLNGFRDLVAAQIDTLLAEVIDVLAEPGEQVRGSRALGT